MAGVTDFHHVPSLCCDVPPRIPGPLTPPQLTSFPAAPYYIPQFPATTTSITERMFGKNFMVIVRPGG